MTANARPLSPHLQVYRLAFTTVLSGLHRTTGLLLTAATVVLVAWLVAAVCGARCYAAVGGLLASWPVRIMLAGTLAVFWYHLFNGVRHLVWDAGFVFDRRAGHNRDFRRALSLGIERDQLNETFWLGIGVAGSITPADNSPYSPGPEWRKKWSTYNPKQASELLDKIGLTKKDSEGYRLRTDGKGRLRIELQTSAGAFIPHTQVAEMIKEHWKKIGIQADTKELERNLFFTKIKGNEHQIAIWANDGTEVLYLFPRHALPVDPTEALMGHPIADWFASNGKAGKAPKDPEMLKALEMFRSAGAKKTSQERYKIAQDIFKIIVDNQFSIGTVGQSPATMGVRIVSKKLGNIPARQVNAQHARTPCSSHPATFFYKA